MSNLDSYDWSVVGYPCNQLPGSPEVVAQTASGFRNTANHLSLAARSLRRLDNTSDTCSEAVDKIVVKANEVAGLLDQVYTRYATSAGALTSYAPALDHAQQQAEQALRAAAQAKHDHDVAQRYAVQAYNHARASTDPLQRQELLQHYYSQKSRAESSASSVDNARAIIAGAIHERDLAAKKAAGQIDGAIHDSQINDGLFDHLKEVWHNVEDLANWIYEHDPLLRTLVDVIAATAKWVWDHLDTIALVLTVAAFALSWVPGLGQVVLVLAMAARLATALSAVKTMGSGIFTGLKTGNWAPFLAAAGTFLFTKLLGKGLGGALKSKGPSIADRVSKAALDKVGKKSWQGLVKESVRQTGSYRTANNALMRHATSPSYHPGHNPLAGLTERGQKTDAMLSTFKGSDFTNHVRNLGHFAHNSQDPLVRKLGSDIVKRGMSEGKHQLRDAFEHMMGDQSNNSSPGGYRQTRQTCNAGGASGGW